VCRWNGFGVVVLGIVLRAGSDFKESCNGKKKRSK